MSDFDVSGFIITNMSRCSKNSHFSDFFKIILPVYVSETLLMKAKPQLLSKVCLSNIYRNNYLRNIADVLYHTNLVYHLNKHRDLKFIFLNLLMIAGLVYIIGLTTRSGRLVNHLI